MQRTLAASLPARVGEPVTLRGWLHNRRRLARVGFAIVRDRSGLAQVVVEDPQLLARLDAIERESVIRVRGTAIATANAPGGVEVAAETLEVEAAAADPPPIELFRPELSAQLPTLLDHAAVTWRHPRQRAIWQLAAASMAGFRRTLDDLGFVEIQTPKMVGTSTESGANVFRLDYFGRPAYLAQSPQFYKQTLVGAFERVYEVGPVFRAEPHDTVRHLAEYVSLDVELGFIEDHRDVMRVLRDVIAGMVDAIRERAPESVDRLALELPVVPAEIPAVHFADAQALIEADTGEDLSAEPDLAPAHEQWLGDWVRREHASEFLFVPGYPMAKRPFYTHPEPGRPEFSNSFDLLFRGLELVTGGQRLHRYTDYVHAIQARGDAPEAYATYLEAFRHGMPPHGGFAIGLERWVARLVGASNIREVTLFPHDLHRLAP
jgi:nondiscriminating aspartyl-tRNA synthetase